MPGAPKVYVHEDINPPQNPKQFLQTNDIVLWKADLGNGPQTYQYEPNTGNWVPLAPAMVQKLLPAPAVPGAGDAAEIPAAPSSPAPAVPTGATGAGTTHAAFSDHTVAGQDERNRAAREKKMQENQAVGNLQQRASSEGVMGGLSLGERATAQKMIDGGMDPKEAVATVVQQRTAGAQADALEQQR